MVPERMERPLEELTELVWRSEGGGAEGPEPVANTEPAGGTSVGGPVVGPWPGTRCTRIRPAMSSP